MIADNLKILTGEIAEECDKIGRKHEDLTLIGVSKYQPLKAVNEAYEFGLRNFGENKAQELRDKFTEFDKNVFWHFIGHLQRNKVKYVIRPAEFIHSVDSIKLAAEIEKQAAKVGKVQKILLEIKTSEEDSKFGLENEEEIEKLVEFSGLSASLDLVGLMTMAPYTDDEVEIGKSFSKLRKLKEKLNASGANIFHLSMGMSGDWKIALKEGATMLRIGTTIFGNRNYN